MLVHDVLSKLRLFLAILLVGSSVGCSSETRSSSRGYEERLRVGELCSGMRGTRYEDSLSAGSNHVPRTSHLAPRKNKDTLTFAFVGDIMMGTTFPSRQLPENGGKDLFRDVKDILLSADITAGNLEGTLCDGGTTTKKVSSICYAFRTPTSYSHYLKDVGFDFLSMANNHAHDFGQEGIRSTEQQLKANGIAYAGIGGRQEYAIIEVPALQDSMSRSPEKTLKIGFCAFGHNSYTIMHTDTATVGRIVRKLRQQVDILVVSFHGGAEGAKASHLPQGKELFLGENRGNLRLLAHQCIDLGADIVYGHGPHVPRCMELYKGKIVAYSLGNFCTPRSVSLKGISGYAPILEVKTDREGNFIEGQIHSFIQQPGVGPRSDSQNRAAQLIRDLTASDIRNSSITIDNNGKILKNNK
ncbi:MAG: CapA family protein [Prevotella sp.]|nr:CapA family protein [Prevotella sp.]